jgi:cobalt/nickel transport system permease protein
MHLPDGFIDAKTAIASGVLALGGLGFALHQVKRELPPRQVPLLGLSAAFLFAAQMVNFPIAGGSSGHLIGSALVTALLGAPAAVIVVSTVVIAQCFLFADGGVTALGANIFNMAVLAPWVSDGVMRGVRKVLPGPRGEITALAFASWVSTVAAAICCAGQLAWSGTAPWSVAFPAMAGIHLVIGLGEAAISAIVYGTVVKVRPELLAETRAAKRGSGLVYGLLTALGIALFVSPFACTWPDGLETVAAHLGFDHKSLSAAGPVFSNYKIPGVKSAALATALAGGVGTLLAFALALGLGRLLVRSAAPSDI